MASDVPVNDSDTHARRNVVALSASIIFAGYLDLKVPVLMSFLSFDAATETSQLGKIWAVLFILLVYLVLRYHFTPDRAERWTAGGKRLEALHLKWFSPWAAEHCAAACTQIRREKNPNAQGIDPGIYSIPWLQTSGWRDVRFQYTTEDEDTAQFESRYFDDNTEYGRLPIPLALWNVIASFIVRMLLSRDGLEVAVPYWLAVIAAFVCISKAGWMQLTAQWLGLSCAMALADAGSLTLSQNV